MASRMLWVAVGAVGGVMVYRRGQRAVETARARGFVGNVAAVAGTAARVASMVAQPQPARGVGDPMPVYVDHSVRSLDSIQVTPVRRTPLSRRRAGIPSTALRLEALPPNSVVDVRDLRTGTGG